MGKLLYSTPFDRKLTLQYYLLGKVPTLADVVMFTVAKRTSLLSQDAKKFFNFATNSVCLSNLDLNQFGWSDH
jgi:hypothetical protein